MTSTLSRTDDRVARLRTDDGWICGVAADHRDSFRVALEEQGLDDVPDSGIAAIKADVVDALADTASVVLLDAEIGLPAVRTAGLLSGGRPAVAVPLEAQGYGKPHEVVQTVLLEDVTPAWAAAEGAAACKLLLPYRPDVSDRAAVQREVAAEAAEACRVAGIPLILEPIVWAAPDEPLGPSHFAELVIQSAAELAPLSPGLMKVQYPGTPDACVALNRACGTEPWVLLGGGAPLDELARWIGDAVVAGAAGFIVGRSLFKPALTLDETVRRNALDTTAVPALASLMAAVRSAGTRDPHRPV